jgi:F-type H+-transporting ATPase subunit gamma|tara:strand:- start:590 stop:892 length:303 start_codon:yes stop_codon:yes gene_type:complete
MKEKLEFEDIDTPLLQTRDVKNVALVVISGERGLCGPYNSRIIKLTEARIEELRSQGIEPKLIFIGKKAYDYFKKPQRTADIVLATNINGSPTSEDSQTV